MRRIAALVAVLAVAYAAVFFYLRGLDDAAPEETYVVLVRTQAPTPSETVTAWNAYEAAPQTANSPEAAIRSFARDSGLTGEMRAVPIDDWNPEEAR